MTDERLSKARQTLLITKVIRLAAALCLIFLLAVWFYPKEVPVSQPAMVTIDSTISAYEQFCRNNTDINCITPESLVAEEDKSSVIFLETNEIDEALKLQISTIVENGSDLNIHPEDMNKLLDHLYEEKLPDDILDAHPETEITEETATPDIKNISIVPARKPPYFGKVPLIVIVIDDMGISIKRTADIASLKAPITASFLTYGRKLEEQIANSLNSGQEIMIHVPMEAKTAVDVAPDVLTTQMSKDEIKNNLIKMLKKFKNVKGINNHMGSKLTEDFERMKAVMEVLKGEGLYFLDSKTSAQSKAETAASEVGIAYAHRHVFLDNNNDKEYILGQLAQTERLARKNGYAIAIGHPKTQTYAALKEWLPKVAKDCLKIVPLSEIISILHPAKK